MYNLKHKKENRKKEKTIKIEPHINHQKQEWGCSVVYK